MRLRVATLVAAASLAAAAPAAADTYTVIGSGDNSIPAGCAPTGSGTWTCNHLRGAVNEANANGMADTIVIAVPTVTLSVDAIPINSELNIIGTSARQTIIDATGAQAPAFEVGGGATASFTNLTIRRGTGGNVVVVSGTANFAFTRVTGSLSGAGIVNEGTANVTFSLLDANAGGGIDNVGGSQPANLLVGSTTVANNAGFGIRSRLNAANTVDLLRATVARNSGVGMSFDATQDTSVNASIIANNVGNCAGGILAASFSVEDTNSCGMSPADSNRVNADPLLAATLSDQGGQTDVLTIPANSPAADLLVPLVCSSGFDQRFFAVPAGQPCDAGAYDREATDPGLDGSRRRRPRRSRRRTAHAAADPDAGGQPDRRGRGDQGHGEGAAQGHEDVRRPRRNSGHPDGFDDRHAKRPSRADLGAQGRRSSREGAVL